MTACFSSLVFSSTNDTVPSLCCENETDRTVEAMEQAPPTCSLTSLCLSVNDRCSGKGSS